MLVDAMLRQISEAVRINREGKKNVMNSKSKWNYVNVPHLAAECRFRLVSMRTYHLTVLLCIPSAHNNMASTDENRMIKTCFTTVL